MSENLLQETIEKIERVGKSSTDIKYIGNNEYSCTWAEYELLADFDYDSGYGSQEIASDLCIVFNDGSWLERGEYDGSEWWQYQYTPKCLGSKKITSLSTDGSYWCDLTTINAE